MLDMAKRLVVLGLLGTTIDRGTGTRRWEGWRPSISVCQHEDMLVDRFELLHPRGFTSLAETVRDDIRHVSPETEVCGCAARKLGQYAAREVGHLKDVHSTRL